MHDSVLGIDVSKSVSKSSSIETTKSKYANAFAKQIDTSDEKQIEQAEYNTQMSSSDKQFVSKSVVKSPMETDDMLVLRDDISIPDRQNKKDGVTL